MNVGRPMNVVRQQCAHWKHAAVHRASIVLARVATVHSSSMLPRIATHRSTRGRVNYAIILVECCACMQL